MTTDRRAAAERDYGPSLPELLRPRLRALPHWQQAALGALALLALVAIAAVVVHVEAQTKSYTQSADDARKRGLEPIAFNFDYSRKLHISKPPGYYVRAERRIDGTLVARLNVSSFPITGESGLLSGFMPLLATRIERQAARTYEHFRLQFEGRARVNDVEGYQFAFGARLPQAGRPPRQLLGRVVMLPEPHDVGDLDKQYPPGEAPTRGLALTMLSTTLDNVPSPTRVGDEGLLQKPFRSFRFGE